MFGKNTNKKPNKMKNVEKEWPIPNDHTHCQNHKHTIVPYVGWAYNIKLQLIIGNANAKKQVRKPIFIAFESFVKALKFDFNRYVQRCKWKGRDFF